ncbi:MAG: hypothetical protein ACRDEA_15115, partial [Microcystaceae cyanobacterium]
QACSQTPEHLRDILEVADLYLRLFPQARPWLWPALTGWVKEAIGKQFPEYYRCLSPEVS